MLSGVQIGNGTQHDKHNIRGIAHARTNRKDNIFMQRQLGQISTYILEWWPRNLYINEAHGAGHIPLCGIFFYIKSSSTNQNALENGYHSLIE